MRSVRISLLTLACVLPGTIQAAEKEDKLLNFSVVRQVVQRQFSADEQFRRGDLISQSEVAPIFRELAERGWEVEDRDEIRKDVLPAGDPVVAVLRSTHGRKFMARVSGYKLIYDRLDRIVREPGGQRLLEDLVKLPDAARYAKVDTGGGVPDLVGFLPKTRSGKTRQVKDYDKATGKIYTVDQLIERLRESHDAAGAARDK